MPNPTAMLPKANGYPYGKIQFGIKSHSNPLGLHQSAVAQGSRGSALVANGVPGAFGILGSADSKLSGYG